MHNYEFDSPVGIIYMEENQGAISKLCIKHQHDKLTQKEPSLLLAKAKEQLDEYFAGTRKNFNLPVFLKGTDFEMRVWNALMRIPYGETRNYQEIAVAVGSPRGFRAVGQANHRNPVMIIVPCHRVIGKDGSMTGFGGGIDVKEKLLSLEGGNLSK